MELIKYFFEYPSANIINPCKINYLNPPIIPSHLPISHRTLSLHPNPYPSSSSIIYFKFPKIALSSFQYRKSDNWSISKNNMTAVTIRKTNSES